MRGTANWLLVVSYAAAMAWLEAATVVHNWWLFLPALDYSIRAGGIR